MSEIVIFGMSINYEKKGKADQPVVLLHGWGQNLLMMDRIADHLKENYTVYNIDLPGHGLSDEPKEAMGVEDYVSVLRKFVEELNIINPIIIAHSFGCRVAIRYAYKYPVNKMVLTGAAGVRDFRGLKYYFKTYSYKLGKKILSLKPFEKQYQKLVANAGSEDYKNAKGVMRQTFVKVVNDDVSPLLKSIKTETLLVYGTLDEATPLKKGIYMEREMPNATLVTFENDDHYAYYHQADRFNRVLDAYLGD